ncbi:hypothetical protein ACQWHJ_24415, partial [Salmonella enterica subsp. enterica serovar Infantis]
PLNQILKTLSPTTPLLSTQIPGPTIFAAWGLADVFLLCFVVLCVCGLGGVGVVLFVWLWLH